MKSLFAKHFAINAMVMVFSFVVLGGLFLLQVNRFAAEEKQDILDSALDKAVESTVSYIQLRVDMEGNIAVNTVDRVYKMYKTNITQIAEESDSTVITCESNGAILFVADKEGFVEHSDGETVPQKIINSIGDNRIYSGVSNLGGHLGESSFVAGTKREIIKGESLYIFVAVPATGNLDLFNKLSQYFVIMTFGVLLVTLFVTIIVVRQTVKPLRQMAHAARRFARGEYSVRVPLPKYKNELYELAASFNNMAESVENVETTRRGLVANVAHDLRTPMTTIAGFVDGMIDGTIKPDKQEYYLRIVSDEVKRLSRMASSILETSRLESGEKALNYTNFDISETVRRIIIGFEQKLSEKNIDLDLDIPDRLNIYADHDAMFQVIYNLVDNALKFIDINGKLTIVVAEKNGRLNFNISNTGAEIPEENRKYIFDRFFKGEKSRTDSRSGSGLGLYIVKTIVNRHGGDVEVSSANNTTEFHFNVPVK